MDTLFWLANALVAPFWLLMIALPHWPGTRRLLQSFWIVAPAALYVLLGVTQAGALLAATRDLSPAGLVALFGTPAGALLAWVHMLTLDLFAGRWIYLDGTERQAPAPLLAPVLLLTLLTAPLGLSLYLLIRRLSPPHPSG